MLNLGTGFKKNIKKWWGAAAASLALLLFFQNCGDIKVEALKSTAVEVVVPVAVKNIKGTICHQMPASIDSPYRLSSFYILNATAHKFNGNLVADNDADGMVDSGPTDSGGETVSVTNVDNDEDSIPDFVEKLKGLDPSTSDADKDGADLDGIINRRELQLGTDPSYKGDEPAIDYTIEPSANTTGCGDGQPAYQFEIQNMNLIGNRKFTDTVNPSFYSLSHNDNENVLMVLAKFSPDDTRKSSLFLIRFFKIDINNITKPEFQPSDFFILGEAVDACPECSQGATGNVYKKIFAGDKHVCALSTSNYVLCWGANGYGQLGDATNASRVVPVKTKLSEQVSTMALGESHTCAITYNNEVYCWGANNYGQLGLGNTDDKLVPTKVTLGTASAPVHIMAGAGHTCVTFADNSMKCWGRNDQYQLGNGTAVSSLVPVSAVMPASGLVYPITHVSAAGHNSCLTGTNGASFCWGKVNSCVQNSIKKVPGTCGTTTTTFPSQGVRLTPAWKAMETNGSVQSGISIGGFEKVTCWGLSMYASANFGWGCGMQDDGGSPPDTDGDGYPDGNSTEYTMFISRVLKVKMGPRHSCAIWNKVVNATTGEVKRQLDCWGDNSEGAIGQPVEPLEPINSNPNTLSAIKEPLDVASGADFSCAIDKDGAIWCWGINAYGQLGSGDIVNNSTPTKVKNQ